jgi:phage terminase large subunit GpA-like protein
VFSFCRNRKGRRIFACKGIAGPRPIWPGRSSRAKTGDPIYLIGVDTAKDAIYARLNIAPPEPGQSKPGFIHFPVADHFDPEYFEQLNGERRVVRKRLGQTYIAWEKVRDRNEALDTFVGALAMRKALPRVIERGLEYSIQDTVPDDAGEKENGAVGLEEKQLAAEADVHSAFVSEKASNRAKSSQIAPNRGGSSFVGNTNGWLSRS